MALLILPVLLLAWHCRSEGAKPYVQAEKVRSGTYSLRCNSIPSSDDSSALEIIMDNPFTIESDNFFKCRKDYYAFDSLYVYRYWFVRSQNITCIAYKQKQQWYMDTYFYNSFGPGKTRNFYRSKVLSQGVVDSFQRRLEALNYECLPIWLDTIEYYKRKGTSKYCCRNSASMMLISCSAKQHYFRWGELEVDRAYQDRDNKPEEELRSAIAYLISNAGFPKPEIYLYVSNYSVGDSIAVMTVLSEDFLIDSVLQAKTDTSITLSKYFQRIPKSQARMLDSIGVEVLLYTGERYWQRPSKIDWGRH